MALQVVGEAFVSSLLETLFEKIASPDFVNFFGQKKLNHKLLQKMRLVLLSVKPVVNDADNKQIKNPDVKAWYEELKEVICDADQLLDEIDTEVLRCDVEGESQSSWRKRLKQGWFSFTTFDRTHGVESKIEDILDRLKLIVEQKNFLGLEADAQDRLLQKLPGPLVEESIVCGRNAEKEEVIECLLSNDISGEKISAISIVGMGGIGKTTLAQLVYSDSRVKANFDIKAWITISDEFDILKITKMMLESLTSQQSFPEDLYQLQVKLKQTLTRKKFLFVFDDVWNESYNLWDVLKSPLESGAHGSKIVLTTRSHIVASMTGSVLTHNLQGLSNEDCWRLFEKHVFKNIHEHPDLQEIGREIVGKCKGHPLAIKSLAGLLRSVQNRKDWRKILQNEIWELQLQENSRNNILPALWLSYYYLPANLKRCFAYCSIFSKDYEIQKKKLILLWMAEGLLQPEKGKTMEDVGEEYFQDLISRSLFQSSIQDESTILIHDLVHDLAVFVAGESCFRMECDNMHEIPEKVRHLSYISMRYDAISKFKPLYRAKSLRTFLPLKLSSSEYLLTERVLYDLLPSLPCLRVLSLSHYTNVTELPDSIANLKHLRYLDLAHTRIEILPASICTLYNLQTLILSNCSSLIELPHDIGRLVNLRHLFIDGTNLKEMPQQMSGLKNLQTLPTFGLGKGGGSAIKELKHFGNLRGMLSVLGLENVVHAKDALEANFKDKKHLKELVLKWNINSGVDASNALEVLEKIQPHIYLRKLTIENYGGKAFPNWLGDPSFSNIVFLSLHSCKNCIHLPPIGQLPSLKELLITGFDQLQQMDSELYGRDSSVQPFRSLEILKIEHMAELEEWVVAVGDNDSESFPCLRELHIENCPKLRGNLPHRLSALTELVIVECPQLTASLPVALALSQLEVIHCVNMVLTNIPMQLRWLTIIGLRTTKYLLEETDYKNSSLEGLSISDCSSLRSLLEGGFPRTLKAVEIRDCRELELSMGHSYAYLESLTLCCSCDSLRSFPLHLFPRLNRLHIEECYNLKSLSHSGEPGQVMAFLHFLQISSCPNFVSFPKGGLRAPKLKWLWIERCDNLKSLPEQMRYILSLHDLYISDCPELSSFPEGGLPSELRTLSIFSCMKLIASQMKWNLESLTSLEYLSIGRSCVDMECLEQDGRPSLGHCEDLEFFQQGGLVSSTLKSLHISGLCNLKSLDYEGLQHLTSLKELKISKCHGLKSIALEGLSSSLEFIQISDCPLLKKKYRGKRARDWAKIAQNVCMQLDDEVISCE